MLYLCSENVNDSNDSSKNRPQDTGNMPRLPHWAHPRNGC